MDAVFTHPFVAIGIQGRRAIWYLAVNLRGTCIDMMDHCMVLL